MTGFGVAQGMRGVWGRDVGQHGDCMWLGLRMWQLHGMHAGHLDNIHIIRNE